MDLTKIKYFLEVAENQHITRSAENLHISQPSLTNALHTFEKEFSAPLFSRNGRNIELTEYGKFLQRKLKKIIRDLENVPTQFESMVNLKNETIYLNVHAAWKIITEVIIQYKNKYPNINFQYSQNPENDLFDIGITTRNHYDEVENSEENEFIRTEKIYLAVPDNGIYKNLTSINLNRVKNEGFISLMGSKQFRQICDEFCKKSGFTPRIVFESDSLTAVKEMIAANIGIGFFPEHSWGKLEADNIRFLEIADSDFQRDVIFTCKHNKTDNTNVDNFFAFLKKYISSIIN